MVCGSFFIVPMPITDIVDAVSAPYTVWRTLRGIEPLCHNGRATFVTGNAAVTFTVMHEGRKKILKCYTRSNPYLREIYGSKYYPKELCVIAPTGSQMWVDCLLYDYIEGISLDEAICAARDCHDIALLARAFDTMACHILADSASHGDLKPENIIVTPSMEMIPIDYDSAFTPSLAGKPATEVGTAGYQHPARDTRFFDKHLDDYSIAIISTLLHIAATDFSIVERFRDTHENPLQPRDIIAGKCPYLSTHTEACARREMPYVIALRTCSHRPGRDSSTSIAHSVSRRQKTLRPQPKEPTLMRRMVFGVAATMRDGLFHHSTTAVLTLPRVI